LSSHLYYAVKPRCIKQPQACIPGPLLIGRNQYRALYRGVASNGSMGPPLVPLGCDAYRLERPILTHNYIDKYLYVYVGLVTSPAARGMLPTSLLGGSSSSSRGIKLRAIQGFIALAPTRAMNGEYRTLVTS